MMMSTTADSALMSADSAFGVSATMSAVAAGLESAAQSLATDNSGHGAGGAGGAGFGFGGFGLDDDLLLCDPTPLLDLLSTDLPGFADTPTMGGGHSNPFAGGAF